jgi:propanol-preferring alcohol dehydrogenase
MTSYAKSAKLGMKAAVTSAYKTGLKVVTVDKPIPKSGELLVKIKASGCCHTDLHAMEGDWSVKYILKFIFSVSKSQY